jgi:hypothetical protein
VSNALFIDEGAYLRRLDRHCFRGRQRSPGFGALIVSLPLTSVLAFVWLWHDTGDKEALGSLSQSTFWFVLPSLPMFLAFPALLKAGLGFWTALGLACALTVTLYFAMVFLMARLGVTL